MSQSKDKNIQNENNNKFKYPKRTHKQIEHNKSKGKTRLKYKKFENLNENLFEYYNISKLYENIIFTNDSIYEIKKDDIKNQIYEEDFFNIINITGDGNCFYRSISYYLTESENLHKNLRLSVYKYVINNLTKFYEFCYIENNTYYIDIEEHNTIHKYILDDYVDNKESFSKYEKYF